MAVKPKRICRIIAIDPGKATGAAVLDLWFRPDLPPTFKAFRNFKLDPVMTATIAWDNYARDLRILFQTMTSELDVPVVVVNEHYTVTRLTQQSQDTQSLEVTGALRAILELLDIRHTYCDQLPSSAKLVAHDSLLRLLGMFDGMSGHARDACRHGIAWTLGYIYNKQQITHHP